MADITQLLANAADTKADFDFGKLSKSYFEGRDQYAKNELRDAFRNGVPTDENGQPDFGAMAKVLFQKGGLEQGVAASNLDISRQQLKAGQDLAGRLGALESGGQPAQPAMVSPPSANRTAAAVVAPPLASGGAQPGGQPSQSGAPQGGATLGQILTAQGIPNDQLGAASASIARQLGLDDPNAPIDVNNPQVRNVLAPAIQQLKRMGVGQVVPTAAPDCAGRSAAASAAPADGPAAQSAAEPGDIRRAVCDRYARRHPDRG
jgi:hypothetical protein